MNEETKEQRAETAELVSEVPVVFISYSHDSEEHAAWVLKLAERLR